MTVDFTSESHTVHSEKEGVSPFLNEDYNQ